MFWDTDALLESVSVKVMLSEPVLFGINVNSSSFISVISTSKIDVSIPVKDHFRFDPESS